MMMRNILPNSFVAIALLSGIAAGPSIADQLVREIKDYIVSQQKEGLIKDGLDRVNARELSALADFVLSCKGAIPPTPANLLPCVMNVMSGDDAGKNAERIKEDEKRDEAMVAACTAFLSRGLPEWRRRVDLVEMDYRRFIDTEVKPYLENAERYEKRRVAFSRKVDAHNKEATALNSRREDLKLTSRQLMASYKAERAAVEMALAALESKKAAYRRANQHADWMVEYLKQNAQTGRLTVAQVNETVKAFNQTGQFTVVYPSGVSRDLVRMNFDNVNRAEADLAASLNGIESRSAKFKAVADKENSDLKASSTELERDSSTFLKKRESLERENRELGGLSTDLEVEANRIAERGRDIRAEVERAGSAETLFQTCLANLSHWKYNDIRNSVTGHEWKARVEELSLRMRELRRSKIPGM